MNKKAPSRREDGVMKKLVALENLPVLRRALCCLEAVTHTDEELLLVVTRCGVHEVQ